MPILNLKHIFRLPKTLWYQIPRLTFQYSIEKKLFQHKTKWQAKKLGHLYEKTAKNGYLYVTFRQKTLFKVKKSFTKRSAGSKNFSRSEKISSHGNFTHFRF